MVPPPLQLFYEDAGRWPDLIVQNRLVDPPERHGPRLLFYVENQGVCSWSTGIGVDDPPVWADHDGEKAMEDEPLSRFLITVAILEAVLGAPAAASVSSLQRDRFSACLGPLRQLPFSPWRGFPEGTTFYASDDLLAVSAFNGPEPQPDELLSIWVGARDPEALQALDPLIDEIWEYDSRRS
jgi:hypothetical protein